VETPTDGIYLVGIGNADNEACRESSITGKSHLRNTVLVLLLAARVVANAIHFAESTDIVF
jgi:hypothetical protein